MSPQIQRAILSSFAGLTFLLCGVGIGQSQAPRLGREYAISGSVRSEENDSPIPQARVELRTDAGNTAHPIVLTNGSGEFAFGQFRAGEYDVIAELEGYDSVRLRVDITRHDEINLIIRLRKLSTLAPTGTITTAHQLLIPQKAHHPSAKAIAKATSKADNQPAIQEFHPALNN